ncbi:hypothetical protein [Bacillus wiedmannii]|uniref:hypothetical protein n=1 Tax=Bacillus wiedmannii TaxID=1890302 RepID=UPI003CEE42EF
MSKKKKETRKEKEKKAMRLAREKQERGELLTEEELELLKKSDKRFKMALNDVGSYTKEKKEMNKSKNSKKNGSTRMGEEDKKYVESKVMKRYNDRVWKGWRETDGITCPVTGSGGKSANKKK